jgi:hypothetical protein
MATIVAISGARHQTLVLVNPPRSSFNGWLDTPSSLSYLAIFATLARPAAELSANSSCRRTVGGTNEAVKTSGTQTARACR